MPKDKPLISGMKYRVLYAMPGYDEMEMVAIFVGVSEQDLGTTLTFSLAPVANNASLPKKWIHEVWGTNRMVQTPVHVKPETRVW